MFNSYSLGGRSKSTTDVFRASTIEDASYPSSTFSSAFNPNRIGEPGKVSTFEATRISQRARTNTITRDIRRPFEYESQSSCSMKPSRTVQNSPRSNNFVKKLVESLERRQRENISNNNQSFFSADAKFHKNSYSKVAQDNEDRKTLPLINDKRSNRNRLPERNYSDLVYTRFPSQLEDLYERENEESSEEDSEFDEFEDEENWKNRVRTARKAFAESSADQQPKFSARRTLKNVFSSIMSWKPGKSMMPKGSREYYATRESLGEEMRAFRRDAMPRLMERAFIKGRLDKSKSDPLVRTKEQQQFNVLIGGPKVLDESSIATIHPVYGSKNLVSSQQKLSRLQENQPIEEEARKPEVICAFRKVQPPAAPIRTSSNQSPPRSEPLLRPSKLRDIQKRISIEEQTLVQLRKHQPTNSTSSTNSIYDVPKSNRRLVLNANANDQLFGQAVYSEQSAMRGPPEYANVSEAINTDKRLQCTAFTTF